MSGLRQKAGILSGGGVFPPGGAWDPRDGTKGIAVQVKHLAALAVAVLRTEKGKIYGFPVSRQKRTSSALASMSAECQ
jgi:hypothetical protein